MGLSLEHSSIAASIVSKKKYETGKSNYAAGSCGVENSTAESERRCIRYFVWNISSVSPKIPCKLPHDGAFSLRNII